MSEPNWQPVSPKYIHLLRIDKSLLILMLLVPLTLGALYIQRVPMYVAQIGWLCLLIAWVILIFMWAPRRYRVTVYAALPEEIHFCVGALWLRHTVVTHNRIQHLEIEQNPLERLFGLARLIIFTAGGSGADLTIPGLTLDSATRLRDETLKIIRDEPHLEEPMTAAGKRKTLETLPDPDA